jgi:hypothetical protein
MWSDLSTLRTCTVQVFDDYTATVEMRAAGRIVLLHPCDNLPAALDRAEALHRQFVAGQTQAAGHQAA